TFALEQADRAHTYFDSGEHRGKIVLTLGED
ncbi:MAG: zinc-binding dehydrogenase, partial [Rothia dentocariosa]|nr:zinc-binding dehydrogenase [Rothia dentocariosa]